MHALMTFTHPNIDKTFNYQKEHSIAGRIKKTSSKNIQAQYSSKRFFSSLEDLIGQ